MVYRGKPSEGCAHCRQRRIKCDKAVPACAQCIKARRKCFGYRDQLDLIFTDETEHVKKKALAGKRCNASARRSDTLLDPTLAVQLISTSIEHQAYCFFVSNYVWPDSGSTQGHFAHNPTHCGASGSQLLMDAISSVGMAAISNLNNDAPLMSAARHKYVSALSVINTALRNPVTARTDPVLTTVILLSLFENLAGTRSESLEAATKHLEGATALLKLRGEDQLHYDGGLRLFRMLRAEVLVRCLRTCTRVPPALDLLMQKELAGQPDSPSSRLGCLVSHFCNLRALLQGKAVTEQSTIMAMLLKMDTELSMWPLQLSKDWDYLNIESPDQSEGLYENSYHVYADFSRAAIWNNYRSAHIVLHEDFLNHLDLLEASSPLACHQAMTQMYRARSRALIRRLASDICASVPFHITHPHPHIAPAGAVLFLLWPLYVAGDAKAVPPALRLWAIDRLNYIRNTTGIGLAKSLANFMNKEEMVPGLNQPMDQGSSHHEESEHAGDLSKQDQEHLKRFFSSWTTDPLRSG